jgi:hypothetical protein
MKTPLLAIGSVLIASILGAIAPFFFEHGSRQLQGRVVDFVLNPWIIGGMATYLTVMVFFTYAFRLGGTVRVLYPIYASTASGARPRRGHGVAYGRYSPDELVIPDQSRRN